MDFNDSGVPMDGVELDSSTVSRSGASPHSQVTASTTNPAQNNNSEAKQNNDRLMCDNEAIASDNQYYSYYEDSKFSDDFSSDLPKGSSAKLSHNSNSSLDGNGVRNQTHHDLGHGGSQSSNIEILRSFGDLFDDDDLD